MQVGLGTGHIVLYGDPAPPTPKEHSPQFSAHSCCGQMAGSIKIPLSTDIVLDGDPAALPQNGDRAPPIFDPCLLCQTAGWIKMALGMEVVLGPGQIVLDGEPPPLPPKGGTVPRFLAHFYCGQRADWIKMPLGMEVGLGPATLC